MIIPVLIQDPFEDLSKDKEIGRYPRLVLLMSSALTNLVHFIFAALGSIVGLYWSIPATLSLGAGIFTLLITVNWITTFKRLIYCFEAMAAHACFVVYYSKFSDRNSIRNDSLDKYSWWNRNDSVAGITWQLYDSQYLFIHLA